MLIPELLWKSIKQQPVHLLGQIYIALKKKVISADIFVHKF